MEFVLNSRLDMQQKCKCVSSRWPTYLDGRIVGTTRDLLEVLLIVYCRYLKLLAIKLEMSPPNAMS